jgi:hypothetical protein
MVIIDSMSNISANDGNDICLFYQGRPVITLGVYYGYSPSAHKVDFFNQG